MDDPEPETEDFFFFLFGEASPLLDVFRLSDSGLSAHAIFSRRLFAAASDVSVVEVGARLFLFAVGDVNRLNFS